MENDSIYVHLSPRVRFEEDAAEGGVGEELSDSSSSMYRK